MSASSGDPIIDVRTEAQDASGTPRAPATEFVVDDVSAPDARIDTADKAALESIQANFGYRDDLSQKVAFVGNFGRKSGEELVVVDPGKELAVYAAGKKIATAQLSGPFATEELEDVATQDVEAVRLVQDGTLQILTYTGDASDETRTVYSASVYKLIGQKLARVFTVPVAEKTAEGVRVLAKIEFLSGDDHRAIRVTPYTDDDLLDKSSAETYRWNKWEGMFRVPRPVPTAPPRS